MKKVYKLIKKKYTSARKSMMLFEHLLHINREYIRYLQGHQIISLLGFRIL